MVNHNASFGLNTFQIKNTVKSALLALHSFKSCTKAIARLLQIVTYMAVEKGMEHKGEQRYVSFFRNMMLAFELPLPTI